MSEPETIEAEAVEVLGTALEKAGPPPATLFRTDDPGEVMRRAAATAEVLKDALVKMDLISTISGRQHVKVEGWTLLGTMLGVYPVCEWTRPVADGWEARVVATTRDGAVVGAAEAECLRSERNWKSRDDYALRSMAQTRATSKALRLPLGFVVTLAGYEATPAEELSSDTPPEVRQEGPPAYPVPRTWAKVKEAVETCDNPADSWPMFEAFVRAASYHLYGETESKKLEPEQRKLMLQKAATAAVWLVDNVKAEGADFIFFREGDMRKAWSHALEGAVLEVPDLPKSEDAKEAEELEREAEAAQADYV